jgi:hypothetical protein
MPDVLGSWVQVDKGIRHLQIEELAKAKGVPKEWQPISRKKHKLWRTVVGQLTAGHLWTAAMDSLGIWLRKCSPQAIKTQPQPLDSFGAESGTVPPSEWRDPGPDTSEWEVPDLKEGSAWYKARMHSLCHAIHNLPNKKRHLEEGIKALARHSL